MDQLALPMTERSDPMSATTPAIEMGAYEYLWLHPPAGSSATSKSILKIFENCPGALPSDFVSESDALRYSQQVFSKLGRTGFEYFGVRVKGISDYPDSLKSAHHQIPVLYFKGCWDLCWKPKRIAVVGTRLPSANGIKRARQLVRNLADNNYTILSGLAKGIDTVAHETALMLGAPTIAVIGTPIDEAYPKENKPLQEKIAQEGLVISQVPFLLHGTRSWRWNRMFFPERNETMSALSDATVIVEAGDTSGTLIQAKAALKQGRKVFILASNFENPAIKWPAALEKRGAIRVDSIESILQVLRHDSNAA
jgi:DNA processing protein